MVGKTKFQHLAIGTFIVTGVGFYTTKAFPEEDIFSVREIHVMPKCYWLSREIPAEGLCGEKMRPDTSVLIQEAEKGNSVAAMRLGQLFGTGNWGVNRDLPEAIKWYTHAASLGDRYSQIRLGNAYEFGRLGVKKDIRSSVKYYKMATENGIYPDLEERIENLERKLSGSK